jgi:HpcH/HpaI aldolase/citrate lyase family protein
VLTLWTDDPALAGAADRAGIDRVGLDLEVVGKRERQRGLGTWISPHRVDRLAAVREALGRATLFARVNPLDATTACETELLLAGGVEVLMLPMFSGPAEVGRFVEMVDGRARVVLLLETREAAERIADIVAVPGVDEVHVGINDLAIGLRVRTRFEVLDSALVEEVSQCVRGAGLPFGVGGLARVDDASLPIDSDLIYAQHARLGSTAALISRVFVAAGWRSGELEAEVARMRARVARWLGASADDVARARRAFRAALEHCETW